MGACTRSESDSGKAGGRPRARGAQTAALTPLAPTADVGCRSVPPAQRVGGLNGTYYGHSLSDPPNPATLWLAQELYMNETKHPAREEGDAEIGAFSLLHSQERAAFPGSRFAFCSVSRCIGDAWNLSQSVKDGRGEGRGRVST